jgi:hypothetical protein
MDDKQAQLEWEARAGRLAGYAAFLCAAVILGTIIYSATALPKSADTLNKALPQFAAHKHAFYVAAYLSALAMLAFVAPLYYLFRATRFRRSELPPLMRFLVIAGPILFAICSVWVQYRQAHAADQFVAGAVKTKKHAEDLVRDATTLAVSVRFAASIATGLATLFVSLNAMRAGLLSRFTGAIGVILGGLFAIPVFPAPIIQAFWVTALGLVFLNLWPGGRGPAWETGEAEPWPSRQQQMGLPAGDGDARDSKPATEPAAAEPEPARPNPRASRKRKRKSRR